MPSLKFKRKIENFICEHCGFEVIGDGYTNHCPKCLWSKHVDINPGDREASCKGLMRPTSVEGKIGEWIIVHTCERCGYQKRNKVSKSDDTEKVYEVSRLEADKMFRMQSSQNLKVKRKK